MSFSTRLKERRETLGITRTELAAKLGVTPSAIANYENNVSAPKTELLYLLFTALACDANYLYQDVLQTKGRFTASPDEWDLLDQYRELDERGKKLVELVIHSEYEAVTGREAVHSPPKRFRIAARKGDAEAKSFCPKREFDPKSIQNEGDF